MARFKKTTYMTFLYYLGRANVGQGYIDSIILALLKIINDSQEEGME